MNAMQHRSAWVSAAVLLGVAGTSGATSDVLAGSHSVKASGEMHSIPVERIRPQRQGVVYAAVEVERVRPLRTADLLALVAMGVTDGDELCAGSGDPVPTRKTTIPFDRSALVPTGSRWADDRQPTFATAKATSSTSRWGDLVPTPLPAGQGGAPAVATTAAPTTTAQSVPTPAPAKTQASDKTATNTQTSVPEGWPTLTLTAETTTPAAETPVTAAEAPTAVAASQPTTQTHAQANTGAASTAPERTTAPAVTTTATKHTTTTGTLTQAQRTAQLAAMFPAPEGWGSTSPRRAAPSGWDLVATPLPSDNSASSQATPRPDTTTRAEPTATMMPIGAASPTTTSPIEVQDEPASEPATTTASAEPIAMSVRTSQPVADIDEATEAVLAELRRKAVSQDAYDRAMRELAARREAGIRSDSGALMAGDSLGVSIARNAGYID